MTDRLRQTIYVVLGVLLAAGCAWWWFANMEQRWVSRDQMSDAALKNPMLGATRLLARHQHTVNVASTLAEAQRSRIADGTLMLLDNGGIVTRQQAVQLLAWVDRGNVLIVRPKLTNNPSYLVCGETRSMPAPNTARNADALNTDPIGAEFGVELSQTLRRTKKAPAPENQHADTADKPEKTVEQAEPCLASMTFPGADHALHIDVTHLALRSSGNKAVPQFSDDTLDAVRVYAHGKGRVAFVAQNYFDNDHLAWYDNAELLLGLTELNRGARHVLVVQHLDMPPWYQALWWNFRFGIVSAACGLVLLFWMAVRRFGPILPEPDQERRSLIEHIDASGRWLWKLPGGRDILLTTVRQSTERLLLRRTPELLRLAPAERARELAKRCKLSSSDVAAALLGPASKLPIDFTRQIQTLQQLRKHHER
jgi:hypothetical protein